MSERLFNFCGDAMGSWASRDFVLLDLPLCREDQHCPAPQLPIRAQQCEVKNSHVEDHLGLKGDCRETEVKGSSARGFGAAHARGPEVKVQAHPTERTRVSQLTSAIVHTGGLHCLQLTSAIAQLKRSFLLRHTVRLCGNCRPPRLAGPLG